MVMMMQEKDEYGDHTVQGDINKVKKRTYNKLAGAPKNKPRILDNTNVNKRFKKSTDDELKKDANLKIRYQSHQTHQIVCRI